MIIIVCCSLTDKIALLLHSQSTLTRNPSKGHNSPPGTAISHADSHGSVDDGEGGEQVSMSVFSVCFLNGWCMMQFRR